MEPAASLKRAASHRSADSKARRARRSRSGASRADRIARGRCRRPPTCCLDSEPLLSCAGATAANASDLGAAVSTGFSVSAASRFQTSAASRFQTSAAPITSAACDFAAAASGFRPPPPSKP